jgi:ABC-type dipeptide/oligopeptide/nickel transport system permease component
MIQFGIGIDPLLGAVFIVLTNIAVNMLYPVLDPRVRVK